MSLPDGPLGTDRAIADARRRLQGDLPATMRYHVLAHTAEEVVPAARSIAAAEGVGGHDLDLLVTGAWYHDVGFVERYDDNEVIAADLVRRVLPAFGYEPGDVETIVGIILATRLPQRPTTHLQQIMCDADLFVLGTDRFALWDDRLRQELALQGQVHDDRGWATIQARFLEEHHYFTATAQAVNDVRKAANLAVVRARARRRA